MMRRCAIGRGLGTRQMTLNTRSIVSISANAVSARKTKPITVSFAALSANCCM